MKNKMFITSIFALLLLPLANSCDPVACKVGTSVGKGVCEVGAAVGGVAATATCVAGAWFTFGLSCAAAAVAYIGVGAGCAGVGDAVGNACDLCASDDAPDFQEIANKLHGLKLNVQGNSDKLDGLKLNVQEISDKLDGTEQNFQDIFKKLDGTDHKFKEIFQKLDGTEQNLEEITNKLNGFEQNFEEFKDKMDLKFQRIANKLDGIEQTMVENHLKQEAWFHQLVENDKNIILGQAKMIALQQTTVGQLDQLITTTETLGNKIDHTQIISLYGQDFNHVTNVRSKFKLLTRGTSGVIVNDRRATVFRDAVLNPNFGSETSINNIFLMLRGGHILKRESIYATPGNKYCKPEVHKYFVDVLVEAFTMHDTALNMGGQTLSPQLTKNFNENIIKATSAFVQHCDCAPGLKKANRGQVSTLLDQLPSSSQNLIQNRGQVAAMENNVIRFKMDLTLDVKNFEPNEFAESILEKYSVEDIELVVASVMNKKEDDLELHDSADICVDKERNKVKTCAAFTQDSFVTGCVPPQTLEHGRFFCVEDGVTCHVACDKDYVLETTDKTHVLMECLDNTWTPLPATFKCVPVPPCRGGATTLSTSPGLDMAVCKDETQSTCEKDFESLCPAGWNLCTPAQFNNRNHGWDYNWRDAKAGYPSGVIYCFGGDGGAAHYYIENAVLNTDQQLNCRWISSRPGCEAFAGWQDCDEKRKSALCCAPTRTCGDGLVQQEEDCDDGNDSNMDDCLNSCTWKNPGKHGLRMLSGSGSVSFSFC